MKEIKINDTVFYRQEIGYKAGGSGKKLIIYTDEPQSIDSMINKLVDYKAEKLAEKKLEDLIYEKISDFLTLPNHQEK